MKKVCIYTKKLAKYFSSSSCFLNISYKYKEAFIDFYKKETHFQYKINYELAKELSESDAFMIDSGNEFYQEKTFRIDYETIREQAMKGYSLSDELKHIFFKHDGAGQFIDKKDFI